MGPPIEAPFSPGSFAAFLSGTVRVRDGRRLTVRPIQREDAGRLEFHERLSPQTRYPRFFSPVPHLSPTMAEWVLHSCLRHGTPYDEPWGPRYQDAA